MTEYPETPARLDPASAAPSEADDTSQAASQAALQEIPLVRGGSLRLDQSGFRLTEPRGRKRSPIHPYDTITHLWANDRHLLIGIEETVLQVRSRDFAEAGDGPESAKRALVDRIRRIPDAAAVLERMDAAERLGAAERIAWTLWITVLLCLVGAGFQLAVPMIDQVGSFSVYGGLLARRPEDAKRIVR